MIFWKLFLILLVVSSIVTIILVLNRKRKKVLGKLESEGMIKRGNSGGGEFGNRHYSFKYYQGSKNNPSYFAIYITPKYTRMTKGFLLRTETWFDRFFKRLGIISEIETGDREFDDYFYIIPKDENFTRAFLSSDENRELIKNLYKVGFNKITIGQKRLEARVTPVKSNTEFDKQKIEDVVSKLLKLEENITKNRVIYAEELKDSKKIPRIILFVISAISVILALFFYFYSISFFKPLDLMLIYKNIFIYYFLSLILFAWLSLIILKGRATSHYEWLSLVGIMIFNLFFLISGLTMFINGKYDTSTKTEHNATVLKKYYRQSKNSKDYYVVLTSWRAGKYEEKLRVSRDFYNRIKKGDGLKIYTKAGKLGYEWIKRYEKAAE